MSGHVKHLCSGNNNCVPVNERTVCQKKDGCLRQQTAGVLRNQVSSKYGNLDD